jgi:hypothetical protein
LGSGQSANKRSVSAGIAAPPDLSRDLGGALEDEGLAIFDDPLDGLALFELECFGQRCGADEVELASVVGAFDELDF